MSLTKLRVIITNMVGFKMNDIFIKLVKSKIEKFKIDFEFLTRQIFVDKDGQLIHPNEFGVYREKLIKSLIKPFLPARLDVGSGFIITSKDNRSTQCDIIIYDKEHTPVIENEEQRFFPVECVAGVIEVKSNISKAELKEALIKLSNIKKLRNDIHSNVFVHRNINTGKTFSTKNISDQIATFLICESIDMSFTSNDFESFFGEIYTGVDKTDLHNMILSIKNGCFMYFDTKGNRPMYYPYYRYDSPLLKNAFLFSREQGYKYEHILIFLNYFFMIIADVSLLSIEMTYYLGENRQFDCIYNSNNENA